MQGAELFFCFVFFLFLSTGQMAAECSGLTSCFVVVIVVVIVFSLAGEWDRCQLSDGGWCLI